MVSDFFFCLLAKFRVIRVGGDPPDAENRVIIQKLRDCKKIDETSLACRVGVMFFNMKQRETRVCWGTPLYKVRSWSY